MFWIYLPLFQVFLETHICCMFSFHNTIKISLFLEGACTFYRMYQGLSFWVGQPFSEPPVWAIGHYVTLRGRAPPTIKETQNARYLFSRIRTMNSYKAPKTH